MIEFRQSRLRPFGLMLGCFVPAGLGAAIAVPFIPDPLPARFLRITGWSVAALFGLCAVGWLWRIVTAGVTVRTSVSRLYDKRLCREKPWRLLPRSRFRGRPLHP